jgi:NAD(P)-dependent dehydrogenase (short-subunit alcohol dehydrogenase family)
VTPGVTDAPGLLVLYLERRGDPELGLARAAALSPLGRVGQPEDVAGIVGFLCTDRMRFITGQNLIVDGGMTLTYGAG